MSQQSDNLDSDIEEDAVVLRIPVSHGISETQ